MTRNFFSPTRVLNEITPAEKAGLQENITFLTLM
jgi:hypothetical protein